METRFNSGDNVPEWVLKASNPKHQQRAKFLVDVIVEHYPQGVVIVRPVNPLCKDQAICEISRAKDGETELINWTGAPTECRMFTQEEDNV